ncbi:hypothetical protein AB0K87_01860 [Streptomyces sp. NPDC053705]|uniref:hypothetical protein n=1 Tax=Streptomyces TaxID=1883 RepID=UPI0034457A51
MAIATVNPYANTGDQMTVRECVALLAETERPVSETTLKRWIKESGIPTERHGRPVYVSFSDVLVLHAEAVDRNN